MRSPGRGELIDQTQLDLGQCQVGGEIEVEAAQLPSTASGDLAAHRSEDVLVEALVVSAQGPQRGPHVREVREAELGVDVVVLVDGDRQHDGADLLAGTGSECAADGMDDVADAAALIGEADSVDGRDVDAL